MAMIEFQDVQKYYGDFHALKDINLKIEAGETVVLIGPSGSGKSTLIRTVNGLERIQEGKLIVNGQDLADRKTDINRIRKNVGMVFQHFNLYANKTVLENICWHQESYCIAQKRKIKKRQCSCLTKLASVVRPISYQLTFQVVSNNELRLPVRWQ
ncbi:glutamine ABC transporter, ATP-binding protein GlnQ domain protein [Lentilactobacillus kisonensis F0435]|uniref:Glutamine ABC transporter, ATP-binding protein GlnQ domain protein n=1 Tax=Lentilactobacillus kisonensis F0435 TaxID=797516 RepID=H1LJ28_9LACO|nr:glutamine ABC transporter, ATP-binding protein GlnQ domain protein [Lentilactobacillus kisonensis F0435]